MSNKIKRIVSKAKAEALYNACKNTLAFARETSNCGICGDDFDDHALECPVPQIANAIALYEHKPS